MSPDFPTSSNGWVFIERLWRSLKYEEVYLKAYDSVKDARASIKNLSGFL